jgi:branched-chain amino acid transport system substrate-binding protein
MGFIACFSDPVIQSSMGELVDYLFDITPWAPLDSIHCNITGWTAAEFDERYFEYFALRPNYHAASAFADCLILLTAIEETQSLDHEVLLNSIRSKTYETMYATLSFSNGPQANFDALTEQVYFW